MWLSMTAGSTPKKSDERRSLREGEPLFELHPATLTKSSEVQTDDIGRSTIVEICLLTSIHHDARLAFRRRQGQDRLERQVMAGPSHVTNMIVSCAVVARTQVDDIIS